MLKQVIGVIRNKTIQSIHLQNELGEKSLDRYCINNDFICSIIEFTVMLVVLGLCHSFKHLEQLPVCLTLISKL